MTNYFTFRTGSAMQAFSRISGVLDRLTTRTLMEQRGIQALNNDIAEINDFFRLVKGLDEQVRYYRLWTFIFIGLCFAQGVFLATL